MTVLVVSPNDLTEKDGYFPSNGDMLVGNDGSLWPWGRLNWCSLAHGTITADDLRRDKEEEGNTAILYYLWITDKNVTMVSVRKALDTVRQACCDPATAVVVYIVVDLDNFGPPKL